MIEKIKKIWQFVFLIVLAAILLPFLNLTHMSLIEYAVLIILCINIAVEAIDLCSGLGDD